jgi:hypothetical protein
VLGVASWQQALSDDSVSTDEPGPLAQRIVLALHGRSGVWLERTAKLPKGYGSYVISGERRRLGPKFMTQIADALGVTQKWLASGDGPMTEASKGLDPTIGTFLLKLDRLPGLREWIESNPSALTVSQIATGMAIYDDVKPRSREDGRPLDGWGAFFDDALSGRLTGPRKLGDQTAAEALEISQLSSSTRGRLPPGDDRSKGKRNKR